MKTREIKFRVWNKNSEEFIPSGEIRIYPDGSIEGDDGKEWVSTSVDINIIQQFTGLKDKNGKEIYEGDILKNRFGNYEVEYEAPEFQLKDFDNYGMDEEYPPFEESELIGNIYENKNLLLKQ